MEEQIMIEQLNSDFAKEPLPDLSKECDELLEQRPVLNFGEFNFAQNPKEFYENAKKYWAQKSPKVKNMLGGQRYISSLDIDSSREFILELYNQLYVPPDKNKALDVGAGIGRVTKKLLCHYFRQIDLVEQDTKFVEYSKTYLRKCYDTQVLRHYNINLLHFHPLKEEYDVIWCQWILNYLLDRDLICFLEKCRNSLTYTGILIIKENVIARGPSMVYVDKDTSTLIRSLRYLMRIFAKADLICVKQTEQQNSPSNQYSIFMLALRPMVHE